MHIVQADKPKVNDSYILQFLEKLEANTPNKNKIYLVCDNAGYHKAKIKKYLKNSKLSLFISLPIAQTWVLLNDYGNSCIAKPLLTAIMKILNNSLKKLNNFLSILQNIQLNYEGLSMITFKPFFTTTFPTLHVNLVY